MARQHVPLSTTALLHRCPACGKGNIYNGLLAVADCCESCKLNVQEHDAGDGPAVFCILIVGGIICVLAVVAEIKWLWPLWLHMLVWPVLTLVLSLWFLRMSKALIIAMEYRQGMIKKEK